VGRDGVEIRNNPRPVNDPKDLYCYFFSRPPLSQNISLRLRVLKGEKPLFGVCSREALQARPIYEHKTAFFHIVSDDTWHLGGEFEDDSFAEGEGRVNGENEAVMTVFAKEGVIVWENDGKRAEYRF
jgi:hypothetical protein